MIASWLDRLRALPFTASSAAEPVWELGGGLALADPWFLVLLPLGAALFALVRGRRRSLVAPGLAGGFDGSGGGWPRSLRQRWLFLPPLLEALALVGFVLALARPLAVDVLETQRAEGIDVLLVLDRSGSMRFTDLAEPGGQETRLDVVREVALEFARRRTGDAEFNSDRVGLVTFARYPELVCPPTLDFDTLEAFAQRVTLPVAREEDGTGIGVALAKAAELLSAGDAKSKVCVLLSDGANNVELILPAEAADLAAERGVKVYTILAGRYEFDRYGRATPMEIDATDLQDIAQTTGGRFFRARDRSALEAIYAEIEQLERTPREERRERRTHDLYAPIAALGFVLLLGGRLARAAGLARTLDP